MQNLKISRNATIAAKGASFRKVVGSQSDNSFARVVPIGGLSKEDFNLAFDLLSSDKKTVTHNDVKNFIHLYFDWLPEEGLATLNAWKEEVGREQLASMLIDKPLLSTPHQTAFQWFKPDLTSQTLGRHQLKKIAKNCLIGTTPNKDDVKNLLEEFDLDRDGGIGLDDWKNIGTK